MAIVLPSNKKQLMGSDIQGFCKLRIYHRKRHNKTDARYLLKCGCCDQELKIYYDEQGESLEINGVMATITDWRQVLLPLLRINVTDITPKKPKQTKKSR